MAQITARTEPASHAELKRRADLVADLRAAADWIEQHPDMPVSGWRDGPQVIDYCTRTREELAALGTQLGVEVTASADGHMHVDTEIDGMKYSAFHVPARTAQVPA